MGKNEKEMADVLAYAHGLGWKSERTSRGHVKLTHPKAGTVFIGAKTRDHRGVLNAKSEIRRRIMAGIAALVMTVIVIPSVSQAAARGGFSAPRSFSAPRPTYRPTGPIVPPKPSATPKPVAALERSPAPVVVQRDSGWSTFWLWYWITRPSAQQTEPAKPLECPKGGIVEKLVECEPKEGAQW